MFDGIMNGEISAQPSAAYRKFNEADQPLVPNCKVDERNTSCDLRPGDRTAGPVAQQPADSEQLTPQAGTRGKEHDMN
jgi:hypothetical protein